MSSALARVCQHFCYVSPPLIASLNKAQTLSWISLLRYVTLGMQVSGVVSDWHTCFCNVHSRNIMLLGYFLLRTRCLKLKCSVRDVSTTNKNITTKRKSQHLTIMWDLTNYKKYFLVKERADVKFYIYR